MKNSILNSSVILGAIVASSLSLPFSMASAAEEELNLEAESTVKLLPKPKESPTARSNFSVMGRVDLTSQTLQPEKATGSDSTHELKNNHFLLFLKAKASDKTSFMGEFVGQHFYYIDYKHSNESRLQFGKILVPFGDTRRFHHFYGGVQQYPDRDVMFPQIWSSEGLNWNKKLTASELDLYWVNMSFRATSEVALPTLMADSTRQSLGVRWMKPLLSNWTMIVSEQIGEYYPARPVYLTGFDIFSDYNKSASGVAKNLRFAFGIADATFSQAPGGRFYKRGDFIEMNTDYIAPGELHLRYGTYIDNSRLKSNNDRDSLSLGYRFSLDAIKILIEHEWTFEAVNEIDNDLFRVMASLDF